MPQIARPERKHSKLIDGVMHHYDEVRQVPIVQYVPINQYRPEMGVRAVPGVHEVPVNPDLTDEYGNDLTKYWQPEMVMNPEGCQHVFKILDMGKREVQCDKCEYATSFHPAINFIENERGMFIVIKKMSYPIDN